jgi:hypothetical protein
VDELTAQRILGHSRVEITREIYTDLRQQQQQKSVKSFDRGMLIKLHPELAVDDAATDNTATAHQASTSA